MVGWAQIVIAVLLLAALSSGMLRVTMLVNVFAIGALAGSRTWGLPFGENARHPHDAEFIDLVCVFLEVALVIGAAVWMSRPPLGQGWHGARLVTFAVVPVAVLALASGRVQARTTSAGSADRARSTRVGCRC